jgi:hypothetical protein
MQPLPLPPPATKPPRPPSTIDSLLPHHRALLPSCRHLSPLPRSQCAAVVFGQCSVAVGAASCGGRLRMALHSGHLRAALHGGRLCMALRGRRLRAVLRRHCLVQRHTAVVFARRCVAASSCRLGVVVAWPSSSRAVTRLLSSCPRCCRGFVVCVIWSSSLPGRRGAKAHTFPRPRKRQGLCRGEGRRPCPCVGTNPVRVRTNGGQAQKGGGGQRAIGGGGRRRGHVPSCAPANGGGCTGEGSKAAALPLRDSGANLVRARTGGRAQRGASACNKGRGREGSRTFPCPRKRQGLCRGGAAALTLHDSGANPICAQTGGRAQTGG